MATKKMLMRDWVGRTVRLKVTKETGDGVIFKKGEELKVYGTYQGRLNLEALSVCEHCGRGRRCYIKGIDPYFVELLPLEAADG